MINGYRHLLYHLSTKHDPPIVREVYKEMDKQRIKRIRENVRAALKELFVGWVLPIGGLFAGAYTLINLMRYILICIYTLAR